MEDKNQQNQFDNFGKSSSQMGGSENHDSHAKKAEHVIEDLFGKDKKDKAVKIKNDLTDKASQATQAVEDAADKASATLGEVYGKIATTIKNTDTRVLIAGIALVACVPLAIYQYNRISKSKSLLSKLGNQLLASMVVKEMIEKGAQLAKMKNFETHLGNYTLKVQRS